MATQSEFSDPANIILQDQVGILEQRIRAIESLNTRDKNELNERNSVLRKENELLQRKNREICQGYEEQLTKLSVDFQMYREKARYSQGNSPSKIETSAVISSAHEESLKQNIQMINLENKDLKQRVGRLEADITGFEKKYAEARMGWANSELEKENTLQKYRDAQEKLREYSSQYTMMEVELYKINERFGQTLNLNNELEMQLQLLKSKSENSSSVKKESKLAKLFRKNKDKKAKKDKSPEK